MVNCVRNSKRSWSVLDFESDDDLYEALESARMNDLSSSLAIAGFCPWEMSNLDKATSVVQSLDEEYARLRTLRSYGILEAPRDPKFERITALASRIFSVPIALVSFVDMGRQWFLSNRGLGDVRETPRDVAFCAHAILSTQDLFIINDTTKDERFSNNGLVTGKPNIRFYAGAPMICPEGYKLGTLCIIDSAPRPEGLSLTEKQSLRELSAFVVETLVQRRAEVEKANEDKYKIIACTAHDLLTPLFGIQLNLSLLMDDGNLWKVMNSQQKDLVQSASSCTDMMGRICHQAIDTYRGTINASSFPNARETSTYLENAHGVVIARLVTNLRTAIELYPKHVPVYFEVADDVPPVIQSDDVRLFRSALNYLTNACKVTESGSVTLRIFTETRNNSANTVTIENYVIFEVDDTGPGINTNIYPGLFLAFKANSLHDSSSSMKPNTPKSIGLGLSSVATNISALGGEYGFDTKLEKCSDRMMRCHSSNSFISLTKKQENQVRGGSIFWFSIPNILHGNDNATEYSKATKLRNKKVLEQSLIQSLNDLSKTVITEKPITSNILPNVDQMDTDETTPYQYNLRNGITQKRRSTGSLSSILETVHNHKNSDFPSIRHKKSRVKPPTDIRTFHKSAPTSHIIPFKSRNIETIHNNNNKARVKEALIIDDSLSIRKAIDRALSNLGFNVSQAENGMVGLLCMKSKAFDIVLCDFLMPIMDGLDCVKQFRAWEVDHRSWFRQYIIGISAHASTSDADCGLRIGMDNFLSKPLKLKTIKGLAVDKDIITQSNILDEEFSKQSSTRSISNTIIHEVLNNTMSVTKKRPFSSTDESVAHHLTGPVCLIAEDSEVIDKTLVHAIEKRGYRISWVENGDDALRLLKMRNWDIVFLDEQMPLLSGSSCVARFRTWELRNRVVRQKHIYLLSGNVGSSSVDSNLIVPLGFDGAFGKPLKSEVLSNTLEKVRVSSECDIEILLRH